MFRYDLYRFYGAAGETFLQRITRPPELRYIYWKRRYEQSRNRFSRFLSIWRMQRIRKKTLIQIPKNPQIGKGFYIGHTGAVIINEKAVLGENINIACGVTIGQENRGKREGVPTIGNYVWIGTNAVVVGNISIGNDVLIAPLSFVNFDVPDHSLVIGNPARIIPVKQATEGYITKTV